MSSIINATTTAGVSVAGDNSGSLQLATNNGTTALTIDTSQRAAFVAGTAALPAITTTGDTNTGIFFSAADTIDFTEGGTATGQFDSSGNFLFNSGYGSVATAYGCRAWVNFNGTGTPAIRASGNVSSITDNGVGKYTANFTTNMPDANYAATIGANINSSNDDTRRTTRVITWSTSSVSVLTGDTSGGANTKEDYEFVTIAVFR